MSSWFTMAEALHLEAVIRACIPNITSLINKTIDELESEMDHLGRPIALDAGSGDELTSLKDYVTRMKEGRMTSITSPVKARRSVENSPFLKKLKKKGIEVLYMVDAIDEYVVANMERIMKARALGDSSMAGYMSSKKTMEINPENSIMEEK
ncbi:hypothetical protein IFM89_030661 [Coptis chinensis]|uniref:Uncharacterized protein n=1 Tax=Coptis chinensis TaxID=261450 RepID=A0A835LD26_9MAGN|nr:hypothetical protein IFM89_030661 [Coptis chinensis]